MVKKSRLPPAPVVRMFLLASVAVVASAYAIHRYYTRPRPAMLVPVPSATEFPAPELIPQQ